MSLTDQSIRNLLTAFSSADPTPGGGSASALASAVGASLLMMVAGLPKTRTGSDEDRAALASAASALADIRQTLTGAIDADTAAYDRVVAAYKRPKASADEQAARAAAIQQALRGATDVPLGVLRLSAAALRSLDRHRRARPSRRRERRRRRGGAAPRRRARRAPERPRSISRACRMRRMRQRSPPKRRGLADAGGAGCGCKPTRYFSEPRITTST